MAENFKSFLSEIGKMDENDRLNPQKNEAYFQTLSRSQQISFTRRIRFEYEVNFISFIQKTANIP